MRADTSLIIPGRPGRRDMNVHFCRDQSPVPAQNRVGRHDRRHLPQHPATESLAPPRQAPTLVVIQTYPTAGELFMENSVLFHQISNYFLLVAVDPSGQGHKQQT
jgi:hypothetical protein